MSNNLVESAQSVALTGPDPGSMWRHYKGRIYRVITCAVIERTMEVVVVYQSEGDGTMWVRPLSEWEDRISLPLGMVSNRFTFIPTF
jgi:hypothetical protein